MQLGVGKRGLEHRGWKSLEMLPHKGAELPLGPSLPWRCEILLSCFTALGQLFELQDGLEGQERGHCGEASCEDRATPGPHTLAVGCQHNPSHLSPRSHSVLHTSGIIATTPHLLQPHGSGCVCLHCFSEMAELGLLHLPLSIEADLHTSGFFSWVRSTFKCPLHREGLLTTSFQAHPLF